MTLKMAIITSLLRHSYVILFIFVALRFCQDDYYRCEPVRLSVCSIMPYNITIMPNSLGDKSQDDAIVAINQFSPLINLKCSQQLVPFLCILYLPVCTVIQKPLLPCRKVCIEVRTGCESIMNEFGFEWPEHFQCEKFPSSGLCVGENHTSNTEVINSGISLPRPQYTTPKHVTSRPADMTLQPGKRNNLAWIITVADPGSFGDGGRFRCPIL